MIQYSGTVINDSFTGQSTQSILDGIKTALLAAGWTLYNRHRATATFFNSPFNAMPGAGDYVVIGQTLYKFYTTTPFSDGSIPVFAGSGSTPQSCFSNLGSAIQNSDPVFNCVQAGTFSVPQAAGPIAFALLALLIVPLAAHPAALLATFLLCYGAYAFGSG